MLRKDRIRSTGGDHTSADPTEVARFDALADEWWKPYGKFKTLHAFNAARVGYVLELLAALAARRGCPAGALDGLTILDAGCGAGLVAEPIAGAGAAVTGIDAAGNNIEIARRHATATGLSIDYRCVLPEDLEAQGMTFDAVVSLEVVEHVADLGRFLASLAAMVKPGGLLVIGTINRTTLSWLLAIIAAENVLGWLPRGTHDWQHFVKPVELAEHLEAAGLSPLSLQGMSFDPIRWKWRLSLSSDVNYLHVFGRRT